MSNKWDIWNIKNTTSHRNSKAYTISFIVLSSIALLLNVFVNIVMLCNKKLRRRPSNKFLMNLLISDGFVCISLISYSVYLMVTWEDEKSFYENYPLHRTFVIIVDVVVCLSVSNFSLITLDRLIAVKWPFFYEDSIPTKQVFIAINVVWVITVVYGIILIILFNTLDHKISRNLGKIAFIVVVIAGFITLLTTNCFVFVEARKQLRAIEKMFVIVPSDKSNKKIEFRKKQFRLVRINIGLIICFFLFWINAVIIRIKLLVYPIEELHLYFEYFVAAAYLAHLYYLCNPIWYVTLNHDVRQEVKLLFKQKIVKDSFDHFLNSWNER